MGSSLTMLRKKMRGPAAKTVLIIARRRIKTGQSFPFHKPKGLIKNGLRLWHFLRYRNSYFIK